MNNEIENSHSNQEPPVPPAFHDTSSYAAAYARRLAEIRAVKVEELGPKNLDVHQVVTTVLGALPEILALREPIAKLEFIDQSQVDALEDYAKATAEANTRYTMALRPPEDIVALKEEAMRLRETFRLDAAVLAHHGLIPAESLKVFRGLTGYKNVAFDLIDLAYLMMSCWPSIEGKSALSAEDLQYAKNLGERLVAAAGYREQGPEVLAEVYLIRQQALTLLVRAYDQVRRALTYLRWNEGDVETIAPSLYASRGRRRPKAEEAAEPIGTPPASPPAGSPAPVPPDLGGAEAAAGDPGGSPSLGS